MEGQGRPPAGTSRATSRLTAADLQQLARIYNLIGVQFHLEEASAPAPADVRSAEFRKWLDVVDQRTGVRQLREFVQKSREVTSATIEGLSRYFIDKTKKTADDKDKIGMLLAEYICVRDPMLLREAGRITRERVASELEPIIGNTRAADPPAAITALLAEVAGFRELRALMSHAVLEQGRKWKHVPTLSYGAAGTLVAVTLYNLCVRAAFYRLLHAELHQIHRKLDHLRGAGVQQVDASGAELAKDESLATIRELCIAWTQPVRASYADGQAFVQVVQISDALTAAVELSEKTKKAARPPEEAFAPAEDVPLTAASPERWMTQAVAELESFQPHLRIGDADIYLSWLEAEIFYSPNPLYKKILTQLIVLRALVQHASETPDYPMGACYEFAVRETARLTAIVDDIHDVVGSVPAGKLAAAVDRVFDGLVTLKEKMDSAG